MNRMASGRQQGAALVVGLVLLVVLTILAVSGVFTATMELRMVRNAQSQERAFQAAEVAIENALANPTITTNKAAPEVQAPIANPNAIDDQYSYTLAFRCSSIPPVSDDPEDVFSIGEFSAYHFQVDANGTGPDNAVAQHAQGFYVIANADPEPDNDCT